jgi:23S rRNA pseudouridine2457 synthase
MVKQYILFYKPYNVLSQFSDGTTRAAPPTAAERQTLKDFVPVPGVYPVGRLDRDSEGLMLLTNNGRIQHRLTDPRYAHPRTYWVQVEKIPTDDALQQLRQGVVIKDYRTRPCEVERLPEPVDLPPRQPPVRFRKSVPTAWLTLTLREGKNRQVRRMTAAVGYPTLRLVRVALGTLVLGDMQPGQWRHATAAERGQLLKF